MTAGPFSFTPRLHRQRLPRPALAVAVVALSAARHQRRRRSLAHGAISPVSPRPHLPPTASSPTTTASTRVDAEPNLGLPSFRAHARSPIYAAHSPPRRCAIAVAVTVVTTGIGAEACVPCAADDSVSTTRKNPVPEELAVFNAPKIIGSYTSNALNSASVISPVSMLAITCTPPIPLAPRSRS